ncbi:hypothetical protein RIF29_39568 [Crotalaria pallida]|uniref:Uncharacterized protein n=1 Tax=Crotalaria pallida TaxID=3830 RepID=A0AAN9HQU3_CROPI
MLMLTNDLLGVTVLVITVLLYVPIVLCMPICTTKQKTILGFGVRNDETKNYFGMSEIRQSLKCSNLSF